jgi:hypothetical protein
MLARGWAQAADMRGLPVSARVWACRFMLADLAGRYPPRQLSHVHEALDTLTAGTGSAAPVPNATASGSATLPNGSEVTRQAPGSND